MDFILGIFTGIGLALFAGYYLNQREKKRKERAANQYTDRDKSMAAAAAMYAAANAIMTNAVFPHYHLIDQLQKAIESENFEEAARLRDLINKK